MASLTQSTDVDAPLNLFDDHAPRLRATWPNLFPVRRGDKDPPMVRGYNSRNAAPVTDARFEEWRTQWPTANIGGKPPRGVVAIDDDRYGGKLGREAVEWLEQEHGIQLFGVPTWRITNRDDGSGLWLYQVPETMNLVSEIGEGADLKLIHQGTGRYVMLPPSIHPSGRLYRWEDPNGRTSAVPPDPLRDLSPIHDSALPLIDFSSGQGVMLRDSLTLWIRDTFGEQATSGVSANGQGSGNGDGQLDPRWIKPDYLEVVLSGGTVPNGSQRKTLVSVAAHCRKVRAMTRAEVLDVVLRQLWLLMPDFNHSKPWDRASLTYQVDHIFTCEWSEPDPALPAWPNGDLPATRETPPEVPAEPVHVVPSQTPQAPEPPVVDAGDPPDATKVPEPSQTLTVVKGELVLPPLPADAQKFYKDLKNKGIAEERLALERAMRRFKGLPESTFTLEDELALQFDDPTFRIVDVIPAGGNLIVVAHRKSGKTTLMVNLVRALADGTPFLDYFDVTDIGDGRVALFNYELTRPQLQDWLIKAGIQRPDRACVLNLRGYKLPLHVPLVRDHVTRWLVERNVKVWILDPLVRAYGGAQNDNDQVHAWLELIDEIKAEAGVEELILPHHTPKNAPLLGPELESGLGAVRWEAWADSIVYLSVERSSHARFIRAIGRDVLIEETQLGFDDSTKRLTFMEGRKRADVRADEQRARTLEAVIASPGINADALDKYMGGKNGTQAGVRKQLVADGELRLVKEGATKRYFLPSDASDDELLMSIRPEIDELEDD